MSGYLRTTSRATQNDKPRGEAAIGRLANVPGQVLIFSANGFLPVISGTTIRYNTHGSQTAFKAVRRESHGARTMRCLAACVLAVWGRLPIGTHREGPPGWRSIGTGESIKGRREEGAGVISSPLYVKLSVSIIDQ